jgi:hypothetical protein
MKWDRNGLKNLAIFCANPHIIDIQYLRRNTRYKVWLNYRSDSSFHPETGMVNIIK